MDGKTSVEIFVAPGCSRCGRSVTLVESLHEQLGSEAFDWRLVDVVAEEKLRAAIQQSNSK